MCMWWVRVSLCVWWWCGVCVWGVWGVCVVGRVWWVGKVKRDGTLIRLNETETVTVASLHSRGLSNAALAAAAALTTAIYPALRRRAERWRPAAQRQALKASRFGSRGSSPMW